MTLRISSALLFAASIVSTASHAAVVKVGSNFATNNCRCAQKEATVAGNATGGFTVGWTGFAPADSQAVVGRSFDASAAPLSDPDAINEASPLRTEFQLDLASGGPDERLVAAWSTADISQNRDLFVARLDGSGAPLATPARVTSDTAAAPSSEFAPAVAIGSDGGFAVAWVSVPLPGGALEPGAPSIRLRRFDATGEPTGAELQVSEGLIAGERPAVCIDAQDGATVVAWPSVKEVLPFLPSKVGVRLRRVSSDGAFLGPEVTVTKPLLAATNVALSCSPHGGFVVVWERTRSTQWLGNQLRSDVLGARYDGDGGMLGTQFFVPSSNDGNQLRPRISHDPDGNFVVVWQDADATSFLIEGRRFFTSGDADGADFQVIARTRAGQRIIRPDVAHRGTAGDFVVVFEKMSVVNGQLFEAN